MILASTQIKSSEQAKQQMSKRPKGISALSALISKVGSFKLAAQLYSECERLIIVQFQVFARLNARRETENRGIETVCIKW